MSWFEAKGLNWAKSALKEAVASIDKALDIQDEPGSGEKKTQLQNSLSTTSAGGAVRKQKLPGGANRETIEKQNSDATQRLQTRSGATIQTNNATTTSLSAPATATTTPLGSSTWGSFTGAFFENPNVQETITAAPRTSAGVPGGGAVKSVGDATITPTATDSNSPITHRTSIGSTVTSGSVELLTPPISNSSEVQSPTDTNPNNNDRSASVETISATSTHASDDGDKGLCISVGDSLPDSIVIISEKEEYEKEEDSISYKTIVGDSLDVAENEENMLPTDMNFPNTVEQPLLSTADTGSPSQKMIISLDDMRSESQHADSDSTQSFEDVQMQGSCAVSQYLEKVPTTSPASDDHTDPLNSKSNSSPHNSNDEMETTTSSDIEIISNPNGNGDSSSTNSLTRSSPLKWKKLMSSQCAGQASSSAGTTKKGHFRGPSEISILSEDSQSELDRLLHRISELSDTLEARELRLLQLERHNLELQERNAEIESTLESFKTNNGNIDTAEGYTQRLSALEKKFQASIRERDALRIQIKDLKEELQLKIPKEQLTESNIMIEELRLEGEKLSKEILQQSNIIKKLRAKEKTTDVTLKKNKEEITSLTDELERLKKTLNAKEEVERTQIEAVHKMSSEKRKLEEENAQQRSKLEDLQSKLSTLQSSFEAAKLELQQRTRQHTDLTRTAEEATAAKKERELLKAENQEIMQQLSELRERLRDTDQVTAKREQKLREENRELMRRLEAAELRAETSAQEASLTTVPLMRQLESLQNALAQRTSNWNQEEKMLLEKLAAAHSKLKSLESVESKWEERYELLQKRCAELEESLSQALLQEEKAKMTLQQAELEHSLKDSSMNKQLASLNEQQAELISKLDTLERRNKALEEKLLTSKAEAEKVQAFVSSVDAATAAPSDVQRIAPLTAATLGPHTLSRQQSLEQTHRSQSPAMSYERNSQEETLEGGSVDWQPEDIDCISNSGRHLSYGINMNFMGHHNTSTLEHLQSMLKQRDGELVHIQWELARLQEGRSVLAEEIAMLTSDLEAAKEKLSSYESLEQNYDELQRNYDALLQMYGEKVERTEELELDLKEAREAYKAQIDELLAQPTRSKT